VVQPVRCSEDQERLAAELIIWCRERAADVKCPRTIVFTLSLPRADTGKLYKRELIGMYAPQNPHGSLT
jgi:long-chain acyl-CoA synthetase